MNDWPYTYRYPYESKPTPPIGRYETALERELRLDEERIADEMERAELRGIVAPDY